MYSGNVVREYLLQMVFYKAKMYVNGEWLGAQKALFMILHPPDDLIWKLEK